MITVFADRLVCNEPFEIFGDGNQVRDFTYIGDAVCALDRAIAAASADAPVFNVCAGKGTTVRDLAEIMADLYQADLVARYRPARRGDVQVSIGDPRRASEVLGLRAEMTLVESLRLTLQGTDQSNKI